MKSNFTKTLLIIVYCILLTFLFRKELNFFVAPDPQTKRYVREEFDFGKFTDFASIKIDGFTTGEKGLYLEGNSTGKLLYTFKKDPDEALTIYVRSYGDGAVPGIDSEWQISYDKGEFQSLSSNIRRFDKRDFLINLIEHSKGKENVTLKLNSVNRNKNRCLTLNWLEIKLINPSTIVGSTYEYPKAWLLTFFLILLITPILGICCKSKKFIFIWLIFLLGFYLRYQNLTEMIFTKLETDPFHYMRHAKLLTFFGEYGFYSGRLGYRGPFTFLISKLFHEVLGYTATHQRFVSMFFSLLAILLTYKLGKKLLNYKAGLALSCIMALNPPLIFESSRGNRFELIMVLILIYTYLLLIRNYTSVWKRSLAAGLSAAFLGLTFASSLLGSVVMAVFSLRLFEKRFNRYVLSISIYLLIISILVCPQLYNKGKYYGEAHFPKFSTRLEASGLQRLPMDKQIRLKLDTYPKKNLNYFDYLFKMHSFSDVAVYHLKGYAKALLLQGLWVDRGSLISFVTSKSVLSKMKIFLPSLMFVVVNFICILGMVKGMFIPRFRVLVFGIIAYLLPIAFMLGWRVFEFHRYIMHVYPLYLFCGALVFIRPYLRWPLRKNEETI